MSGNDTLAECSGTSAVSKNEQRKHDWAEEKARRAQRAKAMRDHDANDDGGEGGEKKQVGEGNADETNNKADSNAPLSIKELQLAQQAHFHSEETYEKEVSETLAVFGMLREATNTMKTSTTAAADEEKDHQAQPQPVRVLSLACGSAVGAEVFSDFFPNPESKFSGMDITRTQTVDFLLKHKKIHTFVLEDLYREPTPSDEALQEFQTATHWMAIHACRLLANRVVHLFKTYAPVGAHLIVVPCCLIKSTELQRRLGIQRWKEIRDEKQNRDPKTAKPREADWRLHTAVQARNELLAAEYQVGFRKGTAVPAIQSLHNIALHFEKEIADVK